MAGGRENLITQAQRDPEQRRAIASAGGKASGQTRRRKKATRDLIRQMLDSEVQLSRKQIAQLKRVGIDAEADSPTIQLLGLVAIANNFMAGDLAAAKFLYEYAQIPDIHAQLEREQMEAAKRGAEDVLAGTLQRAREILGGVDSAIE